MSGGTGNDVIVLLNRVKDLIELRGISEITDLADLEANDLSQTTDGALITAGGDTLLLRGVQTSQLADDDFIFLGS